MHESTGIAAEKSVTATVVEAVAEETGRDPFELPPLYETVDTDALNRLADRSRADCDSNLTVTFAVAGCTVRVTGSGEVRVEQECESLDGSAAAPAGATTDKSATVESLDAIRSDVVEPSASNSAAE